MAICPSCGNGEGFVGLNKVHPCDDCNGATATEKNRAMSIKRLTAAEKEIEELLSDHAPEKINDIDRLVAQVMSHPKFTETLHEFAKTAKEEQGCAYKMPPLSHVVGAILTSILRPDSNFDDWFGRVEEMAKTSSYPHQMGVTEERTLPDGIKVHLRPACFFELVGYETAARIAAGNKELDPAAAIQEKVIAMGATAAHACMGYDFAGVALFYNAEAPIELVYTIATEAIEKRLGRGH